MTKIYIILDGVGCVFDSIGGDYVGMTTDREDIDNVIGESNTHLKWFVPKELQSEYTLGDLLYASPFYDKRNHVIILTYEV